MQRRDVLAAVGSLGAVATAGCTSLGSPTTISNPTREQDPDGDTSLQFRTEEGDQVATLTVQPGRRRYSGPGGGQVSVDVAITHPDETQITGLQLALQAPPVGAGAPAEVALKTPFGTPHPAIDLYAAPDTGATVLAIDDLGAQGDGTVVFQFLLTGLGDSTAELDLDATIDATTRGLFGREYTLTGRALVPLPEDTG